MQNFRNNFVKRDLLPLLSMIYITLMCVASLVVYKLTTIGGFVVSVGSFIIPLVHLLLDIISERYGYEIAKKIILYGLICQFIFALICAYIIILPSPHFWHFQEAYDQILGKLPRVFIGSFLGTIIGLFLNAKLISKWKIFVKGRYFWIRSIGSSAAGQLIFSIIAITYDMYGVQPAQIIINVIFASYIIKLCFTLLAATPAAIIVSILKIYEKTPNFSNNINPFRDELFIHNKT